MRLTIANIILCGIAFIIWFLLDGFEAAIPWLFAILGWTCNLLSEIEINQLGDK